MKSPTSWGFRFLQFCLLLTAFAGFTLPLFCMKVNLTDRTDGYLFLHSTWIALAQDTGGSVAYSFVRLFFAAGLPLAAICPGGIRLLEFMREIPGRYNLLCTSTLSRGKTRLGNFGRIICECHDFIVTLRANIKLKKLIEKHIVLEDIDPVVFYGVGNGHLQMIKSLFPKLRIVARDNVVRILGDEEEMAKIEEDIETMRSHVERYNTLTEEDILDIVKGRKTKADAVKDVLVYSVTGRPIKGRSENQQRLIDAFEKNDMIFAVGPAGTGKTYLSIALAVKALKEKAAKKIILSRPAVEAGEKLGFLPGDMKDKIDPYLQPLYDALEDMIPAVKLQDMMDKHVIQIAPLAFMRGRTLSDAVVILDEAQNTTPAQIRMFLTRMGWNTKMIITGDLTQIDLPHAENSGLKEALAILGDVEGISVIRLDKKDIVRHKLVTRIVKAYETHDKADKR